MKKSLILSTSYYAAYLLIGLTIILCFGQILTHQFVAYDDYVYITQNPIVTHHDIGSSVKSAFSHTYEQNYSPLLWVSYALLYKMFGLEPFYFHLASLLAHISAAFLLFGIARKLNIKNTIALIAVILWALHPLRAEAVAWAASFKELLAANFLLFSFYCWLEQKEKLDWRWTSLMSLSFLLACLCKQTIVPYPWVLLALSFLLNNRVKHFIHLLPMLLTSLLGLAFAAWANREAVPYTVFLGHEHWYSPIPHALSTTSFSVIKLFIPIDLVPDYAVPENNYLVFIGVLIVVAFCYLTIYALRSKAFLMSLALLWAGGFWLLISGIIPSPLEFTADRLSYTISAVPTLIACHLIAHKFFKPFIFSAIFIFIGQFFLTNLALKKWKNLDTLNQMSLQSSPWHYPSLMNDAIILHHQGEWEQAHQQIDKALYKYPKKAAAFERKIQFFQKENQSDKAKEYAEIWFRNQPNSLSAKFYNRKLNHQKK